MICLQDMFHFHKIFISSSASHERKWTIRVSKLIYVNWFNPHQMIILPCKKLQLVSMNSVSTENQRNYVRKHRWTVLLLQLMVLYQFSWFAFTKEEATLTATVGICTLAYSLIQRCCLLVVTEESLFCPNLKLGEEQNEFLMQCPTFALECFRYKKIEIFWDLHH